MGPYLGLVPKQEDSGESQPQLGISKTGDTMVRKLLVGSAHYILGPFGPDTDLRRYGLRLCERGGKNAKRTSMPGKSQPLNCSLTVAIWTAKTPEPKKTSHTCRLSNSSRAFSKRSSRLPKSSIKLGGD